MKCIIKYDPNIKDKDYDNLYSFDRTIEILGVKKLIKNNKNKFEIKELIKPYIKTEQFKKRELHFKNTRFTGVLIQQYCNFKIKYQRLVDKGYNSEFYKNYLNYFKCWNEVYGIIQPPLNEYLCKAILFNVPFDEQKLLNNCFKHYYKNSFEINDKIYDDIINISEFTLKHFNVNQIITDHHTTICINNIIDGVLTTTEIDGMPDYIDDNGIYDLKCCNIDNKYFDIMQVLTYLCIYYINNFDCIKDLKHVMIINPILNRIHYINIDDFGKDNLLKFFQMMFDEYLGNRKIEIINI